MASSCLPGELPRILENTGALWRHSLLAYSQIVQTVLGFNCQGSHFHLSARREEAVAKSTSLRPQELGDSGRDLTISPPHLASATKTQMVNFVAIESWLDETRLSRESSDYPQATAKRRKTSLPARRVRPRNGEQNTTRASDGYKAMRRSIHSCHRNGVNSISRYNSLRDKQGTAPYSDAW